MAQSEVSNGGDAPQHIPGQPGETSSLGLFWPPKETLYHRKKGFYFTAIQSDKDFSGFKKEWDQAVESPDFSVNGKYSRVTIRAVVNNGYLHEHPELREAIEASIPLEGGPSNVFDGMSLVYFGKNNPNRQADAYPHEEFHINRKEALNQQERTPEQLIDKPKTEGYDIFPIDKSAQYKLGDKIVTELFNLYRPFDWREEEIVEMLNSKSRMITAASIGGKIVSAGVAEKEAVQIFFGDTPYQLDLIELTDGATLVAPNNHEGKGLYSAVSTLALREIAKTYNPATPQAVLVFGESNARQKGLLYACIRQGRQITEGLLEKHVPILDPGEKSEEQKFRYNSFYPTFITKKKLLEKYGHN